MRFLKGVFNLQPRKSRYQKHLGCKVGPELSETGITSKTIVFKRTNAVRQNSHPKGLLQSYVKPYSSVSRDTISRWIVQLRLELVLTHLVYKSHSVRAAASSKASVCSVPISEIMSAAGWSNLGTFSKFYQKRCPVQGLLQQSSASVLGKGSYLPSKMFSHFSFQCSFHAKVIMML